MPANDERNGQVGDMGYGVTARDVAREVDRADERQQRRWEEHGRQHAEGTAVLAELREDLRRVLDWQADMGGQIKVIRWVGGIATAVITATLIALVAHVIWGT